jgi:hypothetical protein
VCARLVDPGRELGAREAVDQTAHVVELVGRERHAGALGRGEQQLVGRGVRAGVLERLVHDRAAHPRVERPVAGARPGRGPSSSSGRPRMRCR